MQLFGKDVKIQWMENVNYIVALFYCFSHFHFVVCFICMMVHLKLWLKRKLLLCIAYAPQMPTPLYHHSHSIFWFKKQLVCFIDNNFQKYFCWKWFGDCKMFIRFCLLAHFRLCVGVCLYQVVSVYSEYRFPNENTKCFLCFRTSIFYMSVNSLSVMFGFQYEMRFYFLAISFIWVT